MGLLLIPFVLLQIDNGTTFEEQSNFTIRSSGEYIPVVRDNNMCTFKLDVINFVIPLRMFEMGRTKLDYQFTLFYRDCC